MPVACHVNVYTDDPYSLADHIYSCMGMQHQEYVYTSYVLWYKYHILKVLFKIMES